VNRRGPEAETCLLSLRVFIKSGKIKHRKEGLRYIARKMLGSTGGNENLVYIARQ